MSSARSSQHPVLKALGLGAAWLWLLQALGASLLCFCGHCPTSAALGLVAEPSEELHACCKQHQEELAKTAAGKPMLAAHESCCAGSHELVRTNAEAPTTPHVPQPLMQMAEVSQPSLLSAALPPPAQRRSWSWSRGPPGQAGEPLYLHYASLLI
ncbi:MAG: hypothetical protein HY902_08590 [Deltaproteobacteria bacterium]|nr:hypothetical protein [Deltaproteobacteria bacterium]